MAERLDKGKRRRKEVRPEARVPGVLNPREFEVATWFGRGANPREIGIRLGMSGRSVNELISRIGQKLHLRHRNDLRQMFEPEWDLFDGEGE